MRRFLAVLAFLAGAFLAFGYPFLALLPPFPIGSWPVYRPAPGFMPINASLKPENAPVEVYVDLAASGHPQFRAENAVLTLTASTAGKTVLAVPLSFADATERDDAPQTPERIYRARAGSIATIDPASSSYLFTVGSGDAENIDIARVDLVLEKGLREPDHRMRPIGLGLMALGLVAFFFPRRGRETPPNPNSKPPPPRWGRAGPRP